MDNPTLTATQKTARFQLERRGIPVEEEHFLIHVSRGNIEAVTLFLAAGISHAARDQNGHCALVVAARHGHKDIASLILEAGASAAELVEALEQSQKKKKDV